jgi:DNA polymerase-3 subunit alpha
MEKETLGTFLSEHPLTEVRDALAARVDCSLADLGGKPDGSWVTVGGLVTECKRIRTKRGDPMMFATLDDLDGQVEMLVFNAAFAQSSSVIEPDQVVLVRGRLDHKDRGETKLVVQEAELFEPPAEEVAAARESASREAGPFVLEVGASVLAPGTLEELKALLTGFPGPSEVVLQVRTRDGLRPLRLGEDYRVAATPALRAELNDLLQSPSKLAA